MLKIGLFKLLFLTCICFGCGNQKSDVDKLADAKKKARKIETSIQELKNKDKLNPEEQKKLDDLESEKEKAEAEIIQRRTQVEANVFKNTFKNK